MDSRVLSTFLKVLIGTLVFTGVDGFAETQFGGFIDTYYAHGFNDPPSQDRNFTTQPARFKELNVNLAHVDAQLNSDRVRGRLAFQAGTSVRLNYAQEPLLVRHIQEAVVGYRLTEKLWIDAGVYLSHIGFESWASKDNWTYTRSLMADFSPYYQSGAKITYEWSKEFATQFHLLNGWQNITENNSNKAFGFQAAFQPSETLSFTYNNFLGNEVGDQLRFFNNFIAKVSLNSMLQFGASYDIGFQETPSEDGYSVWQGYALFARYQLTPRLVLALRGEQYFDKDQVVVSTGTPNGFQASGASVNADFSLHQNILWRTEFRQLWLKHANEGFIVTSLSLWI